LRIIAKTKGEQPLEHFATCKVSDDAEISDLWIAFKAAKPE
jgi:hypothetical protein